MSVPNTMRVGPFNHTILLRRRYLFFYFFIMWGSFLPIVLEFWLYWQVSWDYVRPIHFYIYIPLLFFIMYVTHAFTAMLLGKFLITIINKIHPPREGVFLRDISDKDFRYWVIRNVIKRYPFWVAHKFPFPFLDNVCFKLFGVKTKIHNSLFEGWVDTEFLEFGKNVVIGQGAIIQSALLVGNLLIVRKTVIDDDVRIGAHAVVMPGTHIGDKCALATASTTTVGQELESGYIYLGVPATKYKRNWFFEDGLENVIGKVSDVEGIRARYEELYVKRYDEQLTREERKERKMKHKEEKMRRKEKGI